MAKKQVPNIVHGKVTPGELVHFIDIDPDKIFFNVVKGKKLDTNVRASVIDGHIQDSIDQTPEFSIVVHDPDWELLNSGAVSQAIDLKIGKRWYRLQEVDVTDDDVTCVFIVRNAAYLMAHNKKKSISRAKMTRAEFILSLVRIVKKVKIKFVSKQLHKKQKIERIDQNDRNENRGQGLPRGKDAQGLTVKGKQADNEQLNNCEAVIDVGVDKNAPRRALVGAIMTIIQEAVARRSATAGQFVGLFQQSSRYGWPATRDPYKDAPAFYDQYIPKVRENPDANLGTLAAQVQKPLDPEGWALGANRWRAEAEEIVNHYVGGGGPGLTFQEYKKRYSFEIQENGDGKNENYMAAIYRLADEVGWRAFWVNNDLHYESEEDLFKAKMRMRLLREDVEHVNFTIDAHRKAHQMTISIRVQKWFAPIGSVIVFGPPAGTKMIAGAKVHDNPANGRWLVTNIRKPLFDELAEVTLSKPIEEKLEPAPDIGTRQSSDGRPGTGLDGLGNPGAFGGAGTIDESEGAKGIVDSALFLAQAVGGPKIWMASGYRPGDPKDHGSNSEWKAARDIAHRDRDVHSGPPHPRLDDAVIAIGEAFGRKYKAGQTIIDTFHWEGFRVQIIWRTPLYGDHRGHIHIGVEKLSASRAG